MLDMSDGALTAAPEQIERLLGLEPGADRSARHAWWRITRSGSTRFLIPVHPAGVKSALQLVSSRRNYWALRVALWISRITRRPEVVGSTLAHTPLHDLLAAVFPGRQLRFAVYFGTDSVYRKFTVQCQDAQGRVLAYAKISDGARAPDSLHNEASVLRRLESIPSLRGSVPAVLALTERWGRHISVQSSSAHRYHRAPTVPSPAITAYLVTLFSSERSEATWALSPVRTRALQGATALEQAGEHDAADLLRQAVSVLGAGCRAAALPHGRAHGDFLPWNVRLTPEPYVFDWEWSRLAMPFHDLYHYLIFSHLGGGHGRRMRDLFVQLRSRSVRELLAGADPGGLPFDHGDIRWLQAYLTDAFAFYAESTSADGGRLRDSGLIRNLRILLLLSLGRDP
jgi:hypothetical protein